VAHQRRHLEAVHARHLDIQQHDVGPPLLQLGDGVDTVLGGQHVHAVALQQATGDLAHGDRVVDHHDQQRALGLDFRYLRQLRQLLWPLLGQQVRMKYANGRQQVENHHHPTITEDGRARNAVHARELRPQAFHHDLARAGQAVHLHCDAVLLRTHQDHRQRQALADQLGPLPVVQQLAEIAQLIGLPGILETRRIRLVVGLQLVGRHTHDTFNGVQRDRIEIRRTTSMPTPRPENSVTLALVENPGIKRKFVISRLLYSTSGLASPWAKAFCKTRS